MQPKISPRMNMALGQLLPNEVMDAGVLGALMAVPREYFVPEEFLRAAYGDGGVALPNGRRLLAPLVFARLLALADIRPGDTVLDVGCAYGYSTAVIARMCKLAIGCECDWSFAEEAYRHMNALDVKRARIVQVNTLATGYKGDAPYDAIVIEGAMQIKPAALLSLLKEGGRLVALESVVAQGPGHEGMGIMVRYTRIGETFHREEFTEAAGAMLPGFESRSAFIF